VKEQDTGIKNKSRSPVETIPKTLYMLDFYYEVVVYASTST